MTGNRKFFYYYDMSKQTVQKINSIPGHLDEKDLRRLVVGSKLYFAIASAVSGYIFVFSQQSRRMEFSFKMNGTA